MDRTITFIFGLHNHQPVGNFEHVIEEAYQNAYRPFLEVLHEYPDIPFVLHNSGILWDWIGQRHPEYLELLAEMVNRGQVELMSGGYYEPILTVIPERDRQGQLEMMRDFIGKRFGSVPRGCWLTERIWDPHLPKTLATAGLEYVVVDDSHFKSTGFRADEMRGYFRTEEDGQYIDVFPIDKRLRYLIPFRDPAETIAYLRTVVHGQERSAPVVVLADDGEKFGIWPGTRSLCYEKQWLSRFCDLLMANRDWIEMISFSALIDRQAPIGIVYLPTASYSEMMEWALPLRAQRLYQEARDLLAESDSFDEPAEILRGGFWRNFLVKYEESNWMHKRMLIVSNCLERYRAKRGRDGVFTEAIRHLYQAQCNCAYWHGLFGGLYLPHLRSAVFSHLIEAEGIIDRTEGSGKSSVRYEEGDIDGDGIGELVVSTSTLAAIFKRRGGVLRELDIREPAFNLIDTIARRRESYHEELGRLDPDRVDTDEITSIHDISTTKERDLNKYLVYDFYQRSSLLDHFFGDEVDIGSFSGAAYRECGDFIEGEYDLTVKRSGGTNRFVFTRDGRVTVSGSSVAVYLEKVIEVPASEPRLMVRYRIRPLSGSLRSRFAVESVISLLAGNAPDRYFSLPGRTLTEPHLASSGEEADVRSVSLVDEWLGIEVRFEFTERATLWRFPIETVSNSEAGYERIYQGSAIVPVWALDLGRGNEAEIGLVIDIGSPYRGKGGRGRGR